MSLPTKRSATSATASSHSSSSSPHYQPMKKAKSQAVACSFDPSKNGLHHREDGFDPSSMAIDQDPRPDTAAANLSRKKATPPLPGKKLVIKLHKGHFSIGFTLHSIMILGHRCLANMLGFPFTCRRSVSFLALGIQKFWRLDWKLYCYSGFYVATWGRGVL